MVMQQLELIKLIKLINSSPRFLVPSYLLRIDAVAP